METENYSGKCDFTKEALITYKKNLSGLPSFCRLVMLEVFEYYDQFTGTISVTSLDKLARDNFHVDHLRGRAQEKITGDTIRNAFRSIKKAKPDYFQFSNINQKIVISMPFMRELYQSTFNEKRDFDGILATDVAKPETLTLFEESACFDLELATEVAGDLVEVISSIAPVKKNNINKNKQTDKHTQTATFAETRQLINPDFYPSAETIATALNRGYSTVTDEEQIKNFILFNQAISSRWASFDPLYLRWLERDNGSKSTVTKTNKQHKTRSDYHGRSGNTNRKETMDDVYRYNRNAIAPGSTDSFASGICIEGEYFMVMDTDESDLRSNIYQQTRCP